METVFGGIITFLFILAIFDLIVGVSNDAVNFLNSAIGSKAASFKTIIIIAALGIFLGAILSNGMMEIARHGIFRPEHYTFYEIMVIFLAVMITDVILLDLFNSLGMPTSTTVSLVFELLGGSFFMALHKLSPDNGLHMQDLLNTEKALSVIIGIFLSIAIAFFFGMVVQWMTRLVFTFNYKKTQKWFIGIFGGLATTTIIYFMLIKGLSSASFMTAEANTWIQGNTLMIVLYSFVIFTVLMQLLHWMKVNVFKVVVLLGTFALAMAFAGNDLVNFIGVPLAGFSSYTDYMQNGGGNYDTYLMTSLNDPARTPIGFLLIAGAIMVFALVKSKKAQAVVKTSVDLSRQGDGEEMFGSSGMARSLVRFSMNLANGINKAIPPKAAKWIDRRFCKEDVIIEKGGAFDLVRASINLVLAGLLIAGGTSLKLPLSTTYVAFMVAMGTSLSDRAWSRESAVFRITGVLSVIGGWFITAGAAFILCFLIAMIINFGGPVAMVIMLALAVFILFSSNKRFDKKKKKEKKDDLFMDMMASKDSKEIWSLLSQHIRQSDVELLSFISKNYLRITNGFINEDVRALRKSLNKLNQQREMRKVIRRKETLGLRKIDEELVMEKNTWFHLASNNCEQMIFCLKRIDEPCKEHVDNNFNPMPPECVSEFLPVRDKIVDFIKVSQDYLESDVLGDLNYLGQYCNELHHDLSELRHRQLERIQHSKDSLKISLVYLNTLQESHELVNALENMLRYTHKFLRE
ncbi:inorganic phosphate transporter [Porphyromonas pogonae]|uniref:inorganic phosphate transporter n=1 Tax=Porphyromonas pogonae TaxID=867595 RepID=UPI002E77F295|nr:inorganic phosphate transporter [Porphyromonas pogonae]